MGRSGRLPRLIVIADGFTVPARCEMVGKLLESGEIPWIQFRDHSASDEGFERATRRLLEDLEPGSPTLVSVNSKLPLAAAMNLGLHVGGRGPAPADARSVLGTDALIGLSIHGVDDLTTGVSSVVDYVMFGPVFDSISAPGKKGVGLSRLRRVAEEAKLPVFAVGGITPGRVEQCRETGAYGVAVLGGVMDATEPMKRLGEYASATSTQ